MLSAIRVRSFEKGLSFRHGDFAGLLEPGKYRLWSRLISRKRATITVVNTLNTRFEHALIDVMLCDAKVRDAVTVVDLTDNERALIWKDDRLAFIVGPGRHVFWNEPYALKVEVFDTDAIRFEHDRVDTVVRFPGGAKWLTVIDVADHEDALLVKDGRVIEKLPAGQNVFWALSGQLKTVKVDRREQVADVAGQEIMTADKVTLRVNLLVTYQVTDSIKAVSEVADYAQALYRDAQLALRAAVGTRTLDALLADKESVGGEVRGAIASRVAEFGVTVRSVGLRDVILPGEMKTILNQVIEAEKSAAANLIKRREETAAARSQANTARLLAENPVLARMKELELVQEILAGANVSFVLGDTDLVSQVRSLTDGNARKR